MVKKMSDIKTILDSFENAPAFDAARFLEAHTHPAINSFRINRKKISSSPFENCSPVPWCPDGFYIAARPAYAQHPYWHGGAFYVQEASSMFLCHALKQVLPLQENLCVLDACAAPGGKSTLLASLLNPNSILVSNEVIRSRVNVLQENIVKWGNANSIITSCDSLQFSKLPPLFDCIVVDAPCSGSGLFRKDANALNEWSENNVQLCSERQQRIVQNLLPALKSNGILVYSTCSYSIEENELMVDWLCRKHDLETISIKVPPSWNIVNSQNGCYRFYPYLIKGEGFFIALLRKKDHGEKNNIIVNKTLKKIKPEETFTKYLNPGYDFFVHNETIFAATENVFETTDVFKQYKINLIQCGVETGQLKGEKFIPAHALALNEALNKTTETIAVDETTAMQYLRKQTINIDSGLGYKVLEYEGVKLGWVNVIQNRINNMYPTHWRLMK
jgi:16S rRNA C967 or C1407 C5-methylase (RsmB/RsmF family)/NOL1/NOP2/fmu family ribosome biogenesis protein